MFVGIKTLRPLAREFNTPWPSARTFSTLGNENGISDELGIEETVISRFVIRDPKPFPFQHTYIGFQDGLPSQ